MSKTPKITTKRKISPSRKGIENFTFTENQIPDVTHSGLSRYRKSAWQTYQSLPFPSLQDEPWRRTDIRGLNTERFSINLEKSSEQQPPAKYLNPLTTDEERAGQIVSGACALTQSLDPKLRDKGVIFSYFHSAEKEHAELLDQILGQIVMPDEDKFSALTAAMAVDGVFLYVPKGVKIDQPLHSLYWGAGENLAFMNHLVIWLEDDAEVTLVHESASPNGVTKEQLLHTGIVEIHVGCNSQLNFVELQSWGENVWSFTRERAQVLGDGRLEWIFGAVGTHLTKNFSDIDLVETGASAKMSGFYFTSGNQHLDHDTQQNHLAKHTTSDLLYKGALINESRSVWQGMIYVAPGAIGTDGYQANRNLILGKKARADSIPGLEILADDVRCTHGATVGKIDEDELFYLLSRGIPEKDAQKLIVMGFFAPIMDRIPFDGIQTRFNSAIQEKMSVN